jgi:ABC-2 type transport system permease protein
MLRNVALKLVRDQRRALLWWTLGLVALTALEFAFYPSVRDSPQMRDAVGNLPKSLQAFTGGDVDITSPQGYLNRQIFSLLAPLLFTVYAVGLGAGAIAGEEERRTLDLLLATPVSRRRVALQKYAGLAIVVTALTGAFWLALWIGARATDMAIGAGSLAAAAVASALFALVVGALAFALGCLTGRRGPSLAIAAAVAVASYLLNGLASLVDWLEPARWLSPFYLAIGRDPLRDGLSAGGTIALGRVW